MNNVSDAATTVVGADLWAQLVHQTSGRRWSDVMDEEDVLHQALADADARAPVCESVSNLGHIFVCPVCSLRDKKLRGSTVAIGAPTATLNLSGGRATALPTSNGAKNKRQNQPTCQRRLQPQRVLPTRNFGWI